MKATSFFGYKCPKCNSKISVGVMLGGDAPMCPGCEVPMVPDREAQASAANVYCPNCKTAFGLVNSDRCPTCGGPFSKMP